ncbi:MAG: phage holin family protein [Anaerolineales bacterium]|jgi:putative membrane protein
MRILVRFLIVMASLFVAYLVVPGITVTDTNGWVAFTVMALILAFANAIIRPILAFFSCGCIIVTMGLFMLVVNALTLWISSYIAQSWFNVGFVVDGFWAAFFGSIIISLVSFALSVFLPDKE